jgi:hypothetical protein
MNEIFRKTAFSAIWRTAWYSIFLVSHLFVTLLFIGGVALVRYAIYRMGDPKLFDFVPIGYLFDGMDVLIWVGFVVDCGMEWRRVIIGSGDA